MLLNLIQGSKEVVRRIDDDELEDDDELTISGGETSQLSSKV